MGSIRVHTHTTETLFPHRSVDTGKISQLYAHLEAQSGSESARPPCYCASETCAVDALILSQPLRCFVSVLTRLFSEQTGAEFTNAALIKCCMQHRNGCRGARAPCELGPSSAAEPGVGLKIDKGDRDSFRGGGQGHNQGVGPELIQGWVQGTDRMGGSRADSRAGPGADLGEDPVKGRTRRGSTGRSSDQSLGGCRGRPKGRL